MMPQIGRVLINLLNDAFYAERERATHINGQYIPMVSVQTVQRVDAIEVQATDDGPGIPDAMRTCIFEPFFTTKPMDSGAGLGLSMSHNIITQGRGGTLTVESEAGVGTTFIIRIPSRQHHATTH